MSRCFNSIIIIFIAKNDNKAENNPISSRSHKQLCSQSSKNSKPFIHLRWVWLENSKQDVESKKSVRSRHIGQAWWPFVALDASWTRNNFFAGFIRKFPWTKPYELDLWLRFAWSVFNARILCRVYGLHFFFWSIEQGQVNEVLHTQRPQSKVYADVSTWRIQCS